MVAESALWKVTVEEHFISTINTVQYNNIVQFAEYCKGEKNVI